MTTVLVPSCQKYSDAWGPFQALMKHFWPDCPYPVKLITDRDEQSEWQGLKVVRGLDVNWSDNFLYALEFWQEDDEPIIMMQEDFFLSAPVNQELVARAVDYVKDRDLDVNCVRLMPCPGPDEPYDSVFGLIDTNAAYRVSCQTAVWDKRTLMGILTNSNGPASFEIDGTLSKPEGLFLSVYRAQPFPFSYIVSAINRGKWDPNAIKICKDLGIPIDTSRRPIANVQG